MSTATELFLYLACRAQLVKEIIAPALAAGSIVISERFHWASVVYQGLAGKIGARRVEELGSLTFGTTKPDLTIILDVPPEVGLSRLKKNPDRIERRGLAFQAAVRKGFRSVARKNRRVRVINASRPPEEVAEKIWGLVQNVIR